MSERVGEAAGDVERGVQAGQLGDEGLMIAGAPIFADPVWQMSLGERAAVEGLLSQLRPALAIEIGSAQGACLGRIACHSQAAHSFDLVAPSLPMPENVTLHTGDSHELLPRFLETLAADGRNVDFVIVDGDHSAEGVRQDLEQLLDSAAVGRAVIVFHDVANERVRSGIEAVRFESWPKVAHVNIDWISGQLFAEPALRDELWGGLGLVVVDDTRDADSGGSVYEQRYHPAGPLLATARDVMAGVDQASRALAAAGERAASLEAEVASREAELDRLSQRIGGADRALANIKGSASWRLTSPLRAAKRSAATLAARRGRS